MTREVVSLWATRKSIDAGYHPPECLMAWDEFSIDENFEGWRNACKEALNAMGSDLDQYRYVTLRVDESVFEQAFFTTVSAEATARETNEHGQ